jgi:hypothetical protein
LLQPKVAQPALCGSQLQPLGKFFAVLPISTTYSWLWIIFADL